MILLLTAQTMGWCRAYVCECFGAPEVTAIDHCHGSLDASHDHDEQSQPCHHECGSHRDHQMLGASFAAAPLRSHLSADLPASHSFVASLLPPLCHQAFRTAAVASFRWENDPCLLRNCRPRLTVALLI